MSNKHAGVKTSKALNLYLTRYRDDIHYLEIVDAAIEIMCRQLAPHSEDGLSIVELLGLRTNTYPSLHRSPKQPSSIVNRVRVNNAEFAIRRSYTHFGEYAKSMLRSLYEYNPLLVVGKAPGALQYHEIVKLGSFTAIADFMVNEVFKKMEGQRSTVKTIDRLIQGTGVIIDTTVMDDALAAFETRHLLVHNSGRVDDSFVNRHSEFLRVPTKIGGKLPLNIGFANRCLSAVKTLVSAIDHQLVETGSLPAAT